MTAFPENSARFAAQVCQVAAFEPPQRGQWSLAAIFAIHSATYILTSTLDTIKTALDEILEEHMPLKQIRGVPLAARLEDSCREHAVKDRQPEEARVQYGCLFSVSLPPRGRMKAHVGDCFGHARKQCKK